MCSCFLKNNFWNKIDFFKRNYGLSCFLQDQGDEKHNTKKLPNKKSKSTLLSLSVSGSLTIEAAVVVPIFLVAIVTFYLFFALYNYQNVLQESINITAKKIARYSYVIERYSEIEEKNEYISKLELDDDIFVTGISTGYAWNKILTDEIKEYTDKSNIYNGVYGLSIVSSNLGAKDGTNRILVIYKMQFDILGIKKYSIRLKNNCFFRAWIGESIVKDEDNEKNKENQIVYITKYGNVYHLYRDCTYIEMVLTKMKYGNLYLARNQKGISYQECKRCVNKKLSYNDEVYVTYSGFLYHLSDECSNISRDVIEIDIKNVGNKEICSRCKKRKENK